MLYQVYSLIIDVQQPFILTLYNITWLTAVVNN
jgi:hypothetical protein